MMKRLSAALLALAMAQQATAAILITEVAPWGSGDTPYAADWFELTNTGPADVDITGWKVDDSSASPAAALALRGVTAIPAGGAAVFFESDAAGADDAAIAANFIDAWFGGAAPAGFLIGAYGGSGIGLSTSGDAVNLYDSSDALVASVAFGASTTNFSFDNTAGLNNATISTLSEVGVNGAFLASGAVGSPGVVIPEPAAGVLALGGVVLLSVRRCRR